MYIHIFSERSDRSNYCNEKSHYRARIYREMEEGKKYLIHGVRLTEVYHFSLGNGWSLMSGHIYVIKRKIRQVLVVLSYFSINGARHHTEDFNTDLGYGLQYVTNVKMMMIYDMGRNWSKGTYTFQILWIQDIFWFQQFKKGLLGI